MKKSTVIIIGQFVIMLALLAALRTIFFAYAEASEEATFYSNEAFLCRNKLT